MDKNYAIIMAGGIGSRFWPKSTSKTPKQFIDILGTGKSLLQQTYDRILKVCAAENIYISTHEDYKELVQEQLPDLPETHILLEPARRNTAPCIAYACLKLFKHLPESNILITPADHLVLNEDAFVSDIQKAYQYVENNPHLVTLGVEPHKPETGYGYIQYQETASPERGIKKVKTFTEKPNLELAKQFLDSGDFLWNSGVFIWNTKTIVDAFQDHQPDIYNSLMEGWDVLNTKEENTFIEKVYPTLENISIDYGILEKSKNVFVLPVSFSWSDLGTWGSVYAELKKDEKDNAVMGAKPLLNNSHNNIVSINPGKKAIISGLDNFIVVADENRLLICPRKEEQKIKQMVIDLKINLGEADN